MNGIICRCAFAFLIMIGVGLEPRFAMAATLYKWVDNAGDTHFGYRPPPGVVGTVAGEKERQRQELGNPVNCRELQQEHLRLVDQEIARVKNLQAGFGTHFDFTPEARQRFINDLLILRSALVTGRPAEEFAPPDNKRQLTNLQEKYQKDKTKLVDELQTQSQQIQQQRRELERERLQNGFNMQRFWILRPGFIY
ncbi:MAG: DUF4124 domain-containing protein [Candidatus Methylumidiphilus sp.]